MIEEELFHRVLEKPTLAEQIAFLDQECANQPGLRERIERLLRSHRHADSFLQVGVTTDEPRTETPGAVIGAYKLIEQIGEGGMGTVWMAQQTEPVKRVVALKLIKAGMDSKQVIARFEAERQALALMDHANIARVLDAGTTKGEPGGVRPGRPYFVMDLVKGVPITKYCDEHHLTPRQRLELFVPVCQAVQHAHQKGIIHRDLKPSNVLVALYDGKPVPKVIDFGVAKAAGQSLTDKTLVTGFGNIVGTLEYMSPEQAEINQLDIDTRSDIYSLGVLLYELLAGSPPFSRKELEKAGMLEMLRVIREQEPSKPSTKLSTAEGLPTLAANRGMEPAKLTKLVRGELDWIVMKALEKDRNRRYETANGFAMDVQRYLADEPVLACPPSVGYRFRKFVRRNRSAMLAMAGVLALMVVAGAGIWSWQHQEGLRRTEKDFHTELTRRSVESSLEQLAELHSRALWQQAEALLDQADKQLGLDGDGELRERLDQARSNTAFLKRLDEIRLGRSVVIEGKLNYAGSLAEYPKAFLENGFDVLHGDSGELAAKLNASAVRDYLLAALDDWAMTEGSMAEGADNRQRIMAITTAATGQSWRSQFTTLLNDGIRLAALYDAIPENERTPAIINAVAGRLSQLGQDGMRRMESGLRQYPGDFWLHFAFGTWQSKERADIAIGAYRTALAIRPRTAAVHNNLGNVLFNKKEYDAASAEYKEAIRLDRRIAAPHSNLGDLLYQKKEYEAANAEYKKAVRLDPNLAQAHNGLGKVFYDKKDYAAAMGEFEEAIRLDPHSAGAHNNLGKMLRDKKEYAAAIAEYKEAIRLDPHSAEPHNGLGTVLYQKKDYAAASAEYKEAIRLDPHFALPHNNLGNVLRDEKEYAAAIAEFKEAIRLDPKDALPHNGLGNVLYDKKEYAAAIAEFKKAIRLDPNLAEPHNNLGMVLLDKKEYTAAIAEFKEAIRLDPKSAAPHHGLGGVLRDKKEYAAAIAEFNEAIRLDPNGAAPHNNLGNVLALKKEYAAAIAEFKQAIRLDPKYAAPHANLGNVFRDKKEYAAAIAEFKQAIRLDPKSAPPHTGLGNVLYDKGEYAAASAEYKEAIRLDPNCAEPHIGLGIVLYQKKDYAAASAEFKEAIRLEPNSALPHIGLGNVLFDKQDYAAAMGEYKEAIRLDPNNAEPHNNLGAVLYLKKEYEAASAEYKEAIRLDRGFTSAYLNLGLTYQQLGRFSESVSTLKQAAKLMPKNTRIQDVLREATQLLALDQQLTAFRQGSAKPKSPADAVLLAQFASQEYRKEYGLAVRLYADAFAADAKLMAAHRYNAACAACLAAAGHGKDPDKLDDKVRAELRRKALGWLRDDLQAKRLLLEKDANKAGPHVIGEMRRWLADPILTGVREPEALAKLPEAEQQAWQMLWTDVAKTIKRGQGKAKK